MPCRALLVLILSSLLLAVGPSSAATDGVTLIVAKGQTFPPDVRLQWIGGAPNYRVLRDTLGTATGINPYLGGFLPLTPPAGTPDAVWIDPAVPLPGRAFFYTVESLGCSDNAVGGDETDVDCGGSCKPCAAAQQCVMDADCVTAKCSGPVCQPPGCYTDGVKNGNETDVDCGGSCAVKCSGFGGCRTNADCIGGHYCSVGSCLPNTCADSALDAGETSTDCGGPCGACQATETCSIDTECVSGSCTSTCDAVLCTDLVQNGNETDTDCGGICPFKCATGKSCHVGGDCASGFCSYNECVPAGCFDGALNGTETGIDCGGSCPPCTVGQPCSGVGANCQSGVCSSGACATDSCRDAVANGMETDVDCGGPACPTCGFLQTCVSSQDCFSGICAGKVCLATQTCNDGLDNGTETDVDCGGAVCPRCTPGAGCMINDDCSTDVCDTGDGECRSCPDGLLNWNETDLDCGGSTAGCEDRCHIYKTCLVNSDCLSENCTLCFSDPCEDPQHQCLGGLGEACISDIECVSRKCSTTCGYSCPGRLEQRCRVGC